MDWLQCFGRVGVLCAGLALPGCIGGPCVHTYDDDVLHLDAVLDSVSGDALTEVVITEVRYGGTAMTSLSGDGLTSMGEGVATCTLPCSLASTFEGDYEIDISADGYEASTVAVAARYATFNGGCPSNNDDGTRVTTTIDPL